MKAQYILIALILAAGVSCRDTEKPEPPEHLIPRDSLVLILAELHMVDAALIAKNVHNPEMRKIANQIYYSVHTRHGYTRRQFEETIAFYAEWTEEFINVYDDVKIQLKKLETKYMEGEKLPSKDYTPPKPADGGI